MSAADIAVELFDRGWRPFPMGQGIKFPPPVGITGYNGRNVDRTALAKIADGSNLALRMTPDVVGIDVDAHDDKPGLATFADLVERCGPLPPTWHTHSSRGDGSCIRFFRIPLGARTVTALPGIEFIQWFHRYAMVAPSVHPDSRRYAWHDEQADEACDLPPEVGDLPELPWKWLAELEREQVGNGSDRVTPDEVRAWFDGNTEARNPAALKGLRGYVTNSSAKGVARHDTLKRGAVMAALEVTAGYYPAGEAVAVLDDWWTAAFTGTTGRRPDDGEFDRMILWAIGYAKKNPSEVDEKRAKLDARPDHNPAEVACEIPTAWVDAHVGEAFAAHLGDGWLYVTAWRRWMRWDGRRWAKDDTEAIHETARRWIVDLGTAVFRQAGDNGDVLKKIASYKAANRLEAVVKVARRIKAVEPDVFDQQAHLLNARNGVVNLRTGDLEPHDPALYMTKLAGADYDPAARHPDVDAALGCMTPDVAASVQEHLGVSASGHTGADNIAVFDGKGSNGKTTLIVATTAALGDYGGVVPNELVMQARREDHPTIKMTLLGLRFAYIEETEEDGGLRLERLKAISGGAEITGRYIGADHFTFQQTHTLTIATNHRPNVNTAEFAVWRRLRLIPFPYRYVYEPAKATDRPVDTGLRLRLRNGKQQRAAMLAWLVDGAVRAYAGNPEPEVAWCDEILDATNAWRLAEDVVARFINDCVTIDPDGRTKGTDVFNTWRRWCDSENRPPGQSKNFHRKLQEHDAIDGQVQVIRPGGSVTYLGMQVTDSWSY